MRNDPHSIKNLDPAAYEYIGTIYDGPVPGWVLDPQAFRASVEDVVAREAARDSWAEGNYRNRGTCDHCGSYFHYGAVFQHENGDAIVVGHQCAQGDFQYPNKAAYDLKHAKGRAKVQRTRAKGEKLIQDAGIAQDLELDHYILRDIKCRTLQTGKLSEKQIALVKKIAKEERERVAKQEAEKELDRPVREGKALEVKGTILSVKYQDSDYGSTLKMLVRTDYGAKLWGTVPATIEDAANELYVAECRAGKTDDGMNRWMRGHKVGFVANVTASKDECFGFFARPRKGTFA